LILKEVLLMKYIILMLAMLSSAYAENQICWERRPVDWSRCRRDGKSYDRCIRENNEDNEYNFTSMLSPNSYKVYEDFSVEQKQRAMDYADGNRMDPNDAVARVATGR
jgi:hypothetical protein